MHGRVSLRIHGGTKTLLGICKHAINFKKIGTKSFSFFSVRTDKFFLLLDHKMKHRTAIKLPTVYYLGGWRIYKHPYFQLFTFVRLFQCIRKFFFFPFLAISKLIICVRKKTTQNANVFVGIFIKLNILNKQEVRKNIFFAIFYHRIFSI